MGLLRRWFGPSRAEIWRQLAQQMGARYVEGTFWKRDAVMASHGEWTVTLDVFFNAAVKADYTRLRAPYVNPDGFRFTIYRRGLFTGLATFLGMQDVAIGDEAFDRDFVIKGNDEAKLRALFADRGLREKITAQEKIHLSVQRASGRFEEPPAGQTDELVFHEGWVIKDLQRLESLFDLFADTLDRLCEIGSAYESAPRTEPDRG